MLKVKLIGKCGKVHVLKTYFSLCFGDKMLHRQLRIQVV